MLGTGLPSVEEAVAFGELDGGGEEFGEGGGGEELGFGAVGDDAAVAHEQDAGDFGGDVCDVVGDEEDAGALAGEGAEELAELGLGGEVEGVGGLVEEKHFGLAGEAGAGECAGDHDAALLACGHFADGLFGDGSCADEVEEFFGAGAHGGGDGEVGPEGRTRKEAGEDGVAAGGAEGGLAGEFGLDDAEAAFEFGEVPALAAEDADEGVGEGQGVALAGDGFDEGGFAAAVGAEDGDVFAGFDAEGDVVEDDVVAAGYVDVLKFEEGGHFF
jgi:hypothetical protein